MPPPGPQPLPAGVRPPLSRAAGDTEAIARDGCTLQDFGVAPPDCVFGDPNGATTVALVGDSHAAQWFPTLDRLAKEHGWRLVTFTKISCRFTDLRIYSRELKREYTECEQWRLRVVARLKALKPDLIVVSAAEGMAPMVAADGSAVRQGQGMARLLSGVPGSVAIIVDTPWSQYDVPSCLSAHTRDERACATPRATALSARHGILETTAAKALGARAVVVDLTDWICPGNPCPAVLGGMIVYRDVFHMTATFATSLAPALDEGVALIKPNQAELSDFVGKRLDREQDYITASRELIVAGRAEAVALTLGEEGALLVTAKHAWRADALRIEVASTVGAGDSFLDAQPFGPQLVVVFRVGDGGFERFGDRFLAHHIVKRLGAVTPR